METKKSCTDSAFCKRDICFQKSIFCYLSLAILVYCMYVQYSGVVEKIWTAGLMRLVRYLSRFTDVADMISESVPRTSTYTC